MPLTTAPQGVNWTFNKGWTVQDFLNSIAGSFSDMASGSQFDPSMLDKNTSVVLGGMTPRQRLAIIGYNDPMNQLNEKVPDTINAGSFMSEWGWTLPMLAAAAAAAGAGAFGAGAGDAAWGANAVADGIGEGALGSWDAVGGLTGAESAALDPLAWSASEFVPTPVDNFSVADSLRYTNIGDAARGLSAGQGLFSSDKNSYNGSDLSRLLSAAIPSALGAYASSQQTDALKELADKYVNMGAPYRDRLASLYANPAGFLSSPEVQVPVQQGTDALARSLSAKVGNPIDNMTALQEIQNYSANQLFGRLGQEKDRLAGFGGLSSYNQAAPGLESRAVNSGADMWNAIGYGAGQFLNPTSSLEDILRKLQGSNIFKVA